MPNPQAMPTWKALHSGKPKIEPNGINDLLYANVGPSLLAWSFAWASSSHALDPLYEQCPNV